MFSSTFDGEVVNAARAAHEVLRRTGFGWSDVLKLSGGGDAGAPYSYQRPPQPPPRQRPHPADPVHWVEVKACQEKLFVLTPWETEFLDSLLSRFSLSEKQRSRLDMIRDKVKRAMKAWTIESVAYADREQMDRFVRALFGYADPDTFVSLRAFDQNRRGVPPVLIRSVAASSLDAIISAAMLAAEQSANTVEPSVFCPPICTFSNPNQARTADLANGTALSVELDDVDPDAARARLEGVLGRMTVAPIYSGSDWVQLRHRGDQAEDPHPLAPVGADAR